MDYTAESRSVQTCSDLEISDNGTDDQRSPQINMQVNIVMKVSQSTSTSKSIGSGSQNKNSTRSLK
jgi:hypothetical protein